MPGRMEFDFHFGESADGRRFRTRRRLADASGHPRGLQCAGAPRTAGDGPTAGGTLRIGRGYRQLREPTGSCLPSTASFAGRVRRRDRGLRADRGLPSRRTLPKARLVPGPASSARPVARSGNVRRSGRRIAEQRSDGAAGGQRAGRFAGDRPRGKRCRDAGADSG